MCVYAGGAGGELNYEYRSARVVNNINILRRIRNNKLLFLLSEYHLLKAVSITVEVEGQTVL